MAAPVQPPLNFIDGIADAFGPIFGTNFPVYNAANVLVGHVNSASDLAAGNINYLPGSPTSPASQLQVVNFWGFLQPAADYLSSKGITPSWPVTDFVSQAPTDQNPMQLLFQPASEDQYGNAIDNSISDLNPFDNIDWSTIALYGAAGIAAIVVIKKIVNR